MKEKIITIKTKSLESMCKVRDDIHNQLVGNQDYIDSNIVLSDNKLSNEVILVITEDCKNIPKIELL